MTSQQIRQYLKVRVYIKVRVNSVNYHLIIY